MMQNINIMPTSVARRDVANRPSKALAANSVSLGNWTYLRAENAAKRVSCLPHGPAYSRLRPLGGIENCRLPLDLYWPNGMGSVLCSDVEALHRKSVSGHLLAGHAFALEHEVLAEGRRGRLVSGLRSAVQRLTRGPEGCDRRPDESRFRPMQPRHGATALFVGDFALDVRSGPRTKLCARPGAHRHEQEIADRRECR